MTKAVEDLERFQASSSIPYTLVHTFGSIGCVIGETGCLARQTASTFSAIARTTMCDHIGVRPAERIAASPYRSRMRCSIEIN
jgi:hypothetical protein